MPTPELSRDGLLDALRELAAIMQLRGQHGRVYVVGGAAMMLAHSVNRATQDIDAAFEEGYSAIIDAARDVGERRGWPRSWLNEGATVYMPRRDQRHGSIIFDHPALTVVAATAEHMLAMKATAARQLRQLPNPRPALRRQTQLGAARHPHPDLKRGEPAKPTAPGSDAEEARQPAKRSHRSRPPTAAADSGNTAHVPRHRAQTPKREPAQHRGQGTPTVHGARPAAGESQPLPTR